ncbi:MULTISPECIES: hypothetical protein [Hyphomicrobiales]|jgi:hypothetical protein|uniref:Secreted protein n=1 Tax=Bosea massiliensis TaxID=151419 RepID=A0ABW0P7Z8_9HYPH|nr:hypothetical protein [Methylobacterium sp. CCH7-A2]
MIGLSGFPCRVKMLVLASFLILLCSVKAFEARAADGGINDALAEAGCVQVGIKRLPPIGKTQVFEATCAGPSHTIVRVVCMGGRCIADHPHGRRNEPGERDEESSDSD